MDHEPLFKTMDFHGYRQHVESFDHHGKIIYRWMFYVTGFSFCDQFANVLKSDGSNEFVPIDARGRILINGKRYDRNHWNH